MKFGFISPDGTGLPFALRLKNEGHDVRMYVPDKGTSFVYRETGRGLVALASSFPELMGWGMGGVFVFDASGEGKMAERLRAMGQLVIGAGTFCDRLEMDRSFGEDLAKAVGCLAPQTHKFASISDTLSFLRSHGGEWYFKSDDYLAASATAHGDVETLVPLLESYAKRYRNGVKNILQEQIEGTDISTAGWWNGRDWLYPFEGTIENKKLMNGDIGPATGCSMNVVWWYDEQYPKIAMELRFAALAEVFRKLGAPPGIYDVNSIISKKDRLPYFLEWTPRFGYDAEPTAMRSITGELGEFYYNLATGRAADVPFDRSRAQMSVRLSVQPYPWEAVHELPSARRDRAAGAVGAPVGGLDPSDLSQLYAGGGHPFLAYGLGLEGDRLEVVNPTGLVGLACADGIDTDVMNDEILGFLEDDLKIPDLQYRTDAGEKMAEHLEKVRSLGYSTGVL